MKVKVFIRQNFFDLKKLKALLLNIKSYVIKLIFSFNFFMLKNSFSYMKIKNIILKFK